MKDEEILVGAPQCANEIGFYDGEMFYISNYDNGHNCKVWISGQWVFSELCDFFGYIRCVRSLADIKALVEQQKRIAELENYINIALDNSKEQLIYKIAELEKERDDLRYIVDVSCEAHNLEQQAKGLTIALGMGLHASKLERIIIKINELQNQAKQLREGKK